MLEAIEACDAGARAVVDLARDEALRLNHEYVGTEHLLLSLVRNGGDSVSVVFACLGLDPRRIRTEVEKVVRPGRRPESTEHRPWLPRVERVPPASLRFTPRARKVLDLSLREAKSLGSDSIGVEHLLLGLLREDEGIAAQVLLNLGVKLRDLRDLVEHGPEPDPENDDGHA